MNNKKEEKFRAEHGYCNYCGNKSNLTSLKENEGFCSIECRESQEELDQEMQWMARYN